MKIKLEKGEQIAQGTTIEVGTIFGIEHKPSGVTRWHVADDRTTAVKNTYLTYWEAVSQEQAPEIPDEWMDDDEVHMASVLSRIKGSWRLITYPAGEYYDRSITSFVESGRAKIVHLEPRPSSEEKLLSEIEVAIREARESLVKGAELRQAHRNDLDEIRQIISKLLDR